MKKKSIVQHLYDYGIVCSYDKHVLQHKQIKKNQMVFTSLLNWSCMQAVSDNFDCNVSSVNGQKQKHSLALVMLQNEKGDTGGSNGETIPPLEKGCAAELHCRDC